MGTFCTSKQERQAPGGENLSTSGVWLNLVAAARDPELKGRRYCDVRIDLTGAGPRP